MPIYKYTALDINNKKVHDKKEVSSRNELVEFLRENNLYLLKCVEVEEKAISYKFKLNELAEFCRQLSTMLGSGISLIHTMGILVKRDNKAKIIEIYKRIYVKLQQGYPLSVALMQQGQAFPAIMINMIRSGEESGELEAVTKKLATQFEKDHRLKNKVKNAMIYPIILIVVTIIVVMVLFTSILPNFFTYFDEKTMPGITKVVLAISQFMQAYWIWVLIVALTIAAIWLILLRDYRVRLKYDQFKLRIPKAGKLLRTIYTARFARTMSSLYSSGVSMISALMLAKDTINNEYIASQFDEVIKEVRDGVNLSSAIQKIDGFDPKLFSTIYIGEESGKLDETLASIADDFDYEAEIATQRLVVIMEPIMILIIALIIGTVMISVMLPLYTMYDSAGL